ncbi:aquaporin AQPAn.G-like isoform X2 [Chrysoperla carnea]|uniref:aquaporin AQPAn.G-like isoform X2 n=1 Tax=Chrysoperla carnea TaxID=189513 RepID=UPI001D099572|nr:aquaporin AQPAn.G-like isoform X2 [Chrysoperla carnea]
MPRRKNKRKSFRKMTSKLPTCREYVAICLAEVVGTAMLILFGCMGGIPSVRPNASDISGALSFGMTVMMIIMVFGHISGAHLNPAVTIASVVFGSMPALLFPLYLMSQCIGAIIGYAMLKLVTPPELFEGGLCLTSVHPGISIWQGVMVEFLLTSLLILVCCGVWDHRNSHNSDSLPIRFGFAVTALSLIGGPYTGCSMNPARTLGPALFNNAWDAHWIYWVGPMLGGVVPTIAYNMIFSQPNEGNEKGANEKENSPLQKTEMYKNQMPI